MSAQHLRPLLAFVVVAILAAVIFANGLQRQVFDAIREGASVVAGTHLLREPVLEVEEGEQILPEESAGADSSGGSRASAPDVSGATGSSSGASSASPVAGTGVTGSAGVDVPAAGAGDQVAGPPRDATKGHEAHATNPAPAVAATPHPKANQPAGPEPGHQTRGHGDGHQAVPGRSHGHGHDAARRTDDSGHGKSKDGDHGHGKSRGHGGSHQGKAKGHDNGHEGKAKGHDMGHRLAKGHAKGR